MLLVTRRQARHVPCKTASSSNSRRWPTEKIYIAPQRRISKGKAQLGEGLSHRCRLESGHSHLISNENRAKVFQPACFPASTEAFAPQAVRIPSVLHHS